MIGGGMDLCVAIRQTLEFREAHALMSFRVGL